MAIRKSRVVVCTKKNRLTITVAEKITKQSMNSLYTEIRFGVADLKPGFDVVTDLSACSLAALSNLPTFKKITNHLVSAKAGRVVRVIDETKILKKQLINMAARIPGYKAKLFNNLEAADEFLSSSEEPKGLSFALQNQAARYVFGEQEGTAVVDSLSVHSCTLQEATLQLEIGDRVTVSVTFHSYGELLEEFNSDAVVTMVDGDTLGIHFEDVDEPTQERLWERLAHESQCEPS